MHVPNAANGWIKPETLRAVRGGLARPSEVPRILCGDLNIPRREFPDGEVISFARDSRGQLRRERGQEWDEAELGVVPGLREVGFTDAFRSLHGYSERLAELDLEPDRRAHRRLAHRPPVLLMGASAGLLRLPPRLAGRRLE